jgi:hypothetical protein
VWRRSYPLDTERRLEIGVVTGALGGFEIALADAEQAQVAVEDISMTDPSALSKRLQLLPKPR